MEGFDVHYPTRESRETLLIIRAVSGTLRAGLDIAKTFVPVGCEVSRFFFVASEICVH